MDNAQAQFVEHLKQATNVLVTTSRNPSVDQLAAVIGFTLFLNKIDKHATAVFSGEVPPAIHFLEPEKTLEPNTDSLRDFIIAIDKSKADKLRYKVEDSHVKIFITPYRTSISDKDLEFSQGDFNVDLVVLLGVHDQKDLDQAIVAHGRILHDATVVGVATHAEQDPLGSINWVDAQASSLSEMMTELGAGLDDKVLDGQMANALLTGIVAETERFSNQKTTAETMAVSAKLMAAGANQQLVATELQPKPEPVPEPVHETPVESKKSAEETPQPAKASADGSLAIDHTHDAADEPKADELPTADQEPEEPDAPQIHIDEDGGLFPIAEMEDTKPAEQEPPKEAVPETPSLMTTPPTLGGTLTASATATDEGGNATSDPLSQSPFSARKILSHDDPVGSSSAGYLPSPTEPEESAPKSDEPELHAPEHGHRTIQPPNHDNEPPATDLAALINEADATTAPSQLPELPLPVVPEVSEQPEQPNNPPVSVDAPIPPVPDLPGLTDSPVTDNPVSPPPSLTADSARDAVNAAINADPVPDLPPPAGFNSQPLDMDVQSHDDGAVSVTPTVEPVLPPPDLPPNLVAPIAEPVDTTASPTINPTSPPDLPPPMMPPLPGFVQPPSDQPK